MDDSLQNITDALIEHIDKAIAKGSVTNQQVAAVLDFLNERLKIVDGDKYIRKDQPDGTSFLLSANGGLVVRNTEIVEPVMMSLLSEDFEDGIVEEGEDSLIEEFSTRTPSDAITLGELTNVDDSVDIAPFGSLFVKGDNWESVPPVLSSLTDLDNMLMPVFHKVLGKWVFISVSSISGGVTPPVNLEMVLDTGLLDVNKLV